MPSCSPVRNQVIRGIIGVALIAAAALAYNSSVPVSVILVALSFFALKGCPVCWLIDTCDVVDKSRRDRK